MSTRDGVEEDMTLWHLNFQVRQRRRHQQRFMRLVCVNLALLAVGLGGLWVSQPLTVESARNRTLFFFGLSLLGLIGLIYAVMHDSPTSTGNALTTTVVILAGLIIWLAVSLLFGWLWLQYLQPPILTPLFW